MSFIPKSKNQWLTTKSFVKKTKRGKVMKVVREHYLRDDIWCGSPQCKICQRKDIDDSVRGLGEDAKTYLVVDANIILHQLDLLSHTYVTDVIVPSIVRNEVKHRNKSIYLRLVDLCNDPSRRFYVFSNEFHKGTYVESKPGESANDRNDRAIRQTASWYSKHLPAVNVVLLTNDRGNRQLAQQEGLCAHTALTWAQEQDTCPELLDLVARGSEDLDEAGEAEGDAGARPSKRRVIYRDHLPQTTLMQGVREGRFVQGTFRVNRYDSSKASILAEGSGEVHLRDHTDMNRAVDGDRVVVELLPEDQWTVEDPKFNLADETEAEAGLAPELFEEGRGMGTSGSRKLPSGRVVGIIKRGWRPYCGALDPASASHSRGAISGVLFIPHDKRYPRVRIRTRQLENLSGKRIVVAIDSWSVGSRWPDGHFVKIIGNVGDKVAETKLLLAENDIVEEPFSPEVYKCVPPLPWDRVEEALQQSEGTREDLRGLLVCSVDPPGCRDIDDALHCTRLPNGNFEVGVHIADVTHFMHPGTPLDDEASRRGTSVYLVDRRIDMVPKALTEDICSLRAEVDRVAFSVIWELHPTTADIVTVRYTKSAIRSSAALSYQEAQTRMDDERMQDPLTASLRNLNALAKVLRRKRSEAGALTLASAEVKFKIDTETADPLDVGIYQIREANHMVEEFMLLANISVATKILQHYPTWSCLRHHPTPDPKMFDPLMKAVSAVGLELNVESSKALATSLDAAVTSDPYFNNIMRILTTRCMTQAQYICSGTRSVPEFLHYGLATPLYTHFTSPIRRYADVVVHRLLASALGLIRLPHRLTDKAAVSAVCDNLNLRHRNAQLASRASSELHTLIFFKNRTVVADARIIKVKENGLVVFIMKYGIEGIVYLSPKNASATAATFTLDEERQTVTRSDGSVSYTIFGQVNIRISVEQLPPHTSKLKLELTTDPVTIVQA